MEKKEKYSREILNGVTLTAPNSFWFSADTERKTCCNGIGPEGLEWMVPDTIWGLSIKDAGDIHDWMYTFNEKVPVYKKLADIIFLDNMLAIINTRSKVWLLKFIRKKRAHTYYKLVCVFGDVFFYK